MMLSKTAGGTAAVLGLLAGAGTIVLSLNQPENAACVQRLASVFGTHGAAIGGVVTGIVASIAPFAAWFAQHPTHPGDSTTTASPAPSTTTSAS